MNRPWYRMPVDVDGSTTLSHDIAPKFLARIVLDLPFYVGKHRSES